MENSKGANILRLQERVPLLFKSLALSAAAGLLVWFLLDAYHNKRLEALFHKELENRLVHDSEHDRYFLDTYIRGFSQSARIIAREQEFIDYVSKKSYRDKTTVVRYTGLPEWVPKRGVLGPVANIRYLFLLDENGRPIELFQNSFDPLPPALLDPSSFILRDSFEQSRLTLVNNIPFLISYERFRYPGGYGILMLASPIDDNFLVSVPGPSDRDHIFAIADGAENRILASNHPEVIHAGTELSTLTKDYLLSGKTFFDYGSSDLTVQFVSLTPMTEVGRLLQEVTSRNRQQIAITASVFIVLFSSIIYLTGRRIRRFTLRVSEVSKKLLGSRYVDIDKGDELIALVKNFDQLSVEIMDTKGSLRESEENYRLLFESSQDCICHIALDGKILNMNKAGCAINGYGSVNEVIGRECNLSVKENRWAADDAVRRAGRGDVVSLQYTSVANDGREIWWDSKIVPVRREDGAITSVLRISRDITEQRKTEEEIIKAQKMESIGVLAGGIAHDFNNLLTIIGGRIALAKMDNSPDGSSEALTAAENACKRAADITKRLLTFSKGGSPIKKTVPISGLIKESADFASRGSNVKIVLSLPEDAWPVEIDEGQISQVFNNLIINAQQAMPDGGEISISIENTVLDDNGSHSLLPSGRYVKITVRDNGIGIPQEHLGKIFDPYFTTKPKGSGLGLATSYSIIKNHKGYIFAESEPGAGTALNIYLPASMSEVQEYNKAVIRTVAKRSNILFMDDEKMLRDSASLLLKSLGHTVETARDGSEAVELYRKAREEGSPFDVVILDLTVPGGMGGKEAVQKLIEINPDVSVIVSSGYSNDGVMADYRRYGFKGILAKPYQRDNIVEVMNSLIS